MGTAVLHMPQAIPEDRPHRGGTGTRAGSLAALRRSATACALATEADLPLSLNKGHTSLLLMTGMLDGYVLELSAASTSCEV